MKTQLIKKVVKEIEYSIGQQITFGYWVPLQNIGWDKDYVEGTIQKVNRVTVKVLDTNGNEWKVNKEDIVKPKIK